MVTTSEARRIVVSRASSGSTRGLQCSNASAEPVQGTRKPGSGEADDALFDIMSMDDVPMFQKDDDNYSFDSHFSSGGGGGGSSSSSSSSSSSPPAAVVAATLLNRY